MNLLIKILILQSKIIMIIKPTKLETAKVRLLKNINCKNSNEEISIENTRERVNYNEVISKINLPSTAN